MSSKKNVIGNCHNVISFICSILYKEKLFCFIQIFLLDRKYLSLED